MQNFILALYGPGIPYLNLLVQKLLVSFPDFLEMYPDSVSVMSQRPYLIVLKKPEELSLLGNAALPVVSVFLGQSPEMTKATHLFTHRLVVDSQSMKKAQAMLSCIAFQSGGRDIVTIDGTSACGKGTLAGLLAVELQGDHLDTGLIFRAITYELALEQSLTPQNPHLARYLAAFESNFDQSSIAKMQFELRTQKVDKRVSEWSQLAMVREVVFQLTMRACHTKKSCIVAEGRDMGTVVFPLAHHKFFMDCPLEIRAERRAAQSGKNREDVFASLQARDTADKGRLLSPLVPAPGAIMINNSTSVQETFQFMLAKIKERKENVLA